MPCRCRPARRRSGPDCPAAVGGCDSVSCFSGTPVAGSEKYTAQFSGATFEFAAAANLATFKANPARHAPHYGGDCAWAAASNYGFAGDRRVCTIVDGKLYLNYNKDMQAKWEKNAPGLIKKTDVNWQTLGR